MRGGKGPLGTVSVWTWVSLSFGHPLNLVLYCTCLSGYFHIRQICERTPYGWSNGSPTDTFIIIPGKARVKKNT